MAQNVTQGNSGPTPTSRPVVLLLTSNGWGMGHLSRQLALAMALGERAEPIFLSLSGAVPLVAEQGFRAEYCPSPSRGWLEPAPWNAYLAERILALARETQATAVVFDGVFPYRGLLHARRHLPEVAFVWSRRGMWAVGRGKEALKTGSSFDVIVEPGDLGSAADPGLTAGRRDAVRLPPVTLVDVVPQVDRAEARAALGIASEAPVLLVALSAGTGDPGALLRNVVGSVLTKTSWHVAVIRSPLARTGDQTVEHPRIHWLEDVYPLVRYLKAFDAGVASAGYNAAHELPLSGLASLLVANRASAWDDQLSRARGIAERGLALWTTDDQPARAGELAVELVGDARRNQLREELGRLAPADRGGAKLVADVVANAARGVDASGAPLRPRRRRVRDQARWRLAWLADRLRQAIIGAVHVVRGEVPVASPRPHVDVLEEPPGTPRPAPSLHDDRADLLLLTERLSRDVVGRPGPIEQVLAGTSPNYRKARRANVRHFFDVGRWRTIRPRPDPEATPKP